MNEVFGSLYADIYDTIYREKNYDEECSIIRTIFDSYGDGGIRQFLTLGVEHATSRSARRSGY